MRARAAHPARTLSVVAADLIGPTATTSGSVATALVVRPAAAGTIASSTARAWGVWASIRRLAAATRPSSSTRPAGKPSST